MEEKEIRLQKLKELREKGYNPFEYKFDRTHTLIEIKMVLMNFKIKRLKFLEELS